MSDLAAIRNGLATAVKAATGLANTYGYVPRAPVRPCAIITPDPERYLERGDTFNTWDALFQVLFLAAGDEMPEAAVELDGYVDAMLDPQVDLAGAVAVSATGTQSWLIAGGQYPGASVAVGAVLSYCPPTPATFFEPTTTTEE